MYCSAWCPACQCETPATITNLTAEDLTRFSPASRWRRVLKSICCLGCFGMNVKPTPFIECMVCRIQFPMDTAALTAPISRPDSTILESDKRPRHHDPLRPPSAVWIARTGWTPQPELMAMMDHQWCDDCGVFVERDRHHCCKKCGSLLKS